MMGRDVRVEMSNNVCVTLKYSSSTTAPAHKPAPPTARISLRDTESGPHTGYGYTVPVDGGERGPASQIAAEGAAARRRGGAAQE